jgi:DNA-binding SARP family transcriptional activator
MAAWRYSILGALEIERDGDVLRVERGRPRSLLAALVLRAGGTVPLVRLVEDVWGPAAPASADDLVRVYVSQLRKVLGDDAIITRPPGYALGAGEVDAAVFERAVARADEARSSDDKAAAAADYAEALALWRGQVCADAPVYGDAAATAAALAELRLTALEHRFDLELALGRHREAVPELERAVAEQPLRERLVEQLMVALYRSGRQADALETYRSLQARLSEDLGLFPAPDLQELQGRILRQDPALDLPTDGSGTVSPRKRRRWAVAAAALAIAGIAAGLAVWLAGGGNAPHVAGESLAVLAGNDGHVVRAVQLGGRPAAVAAAGRRIAVVDLAHANLIQLDMRLHRRGSIHLRAVPHAIASDGTRIWVTNGFQGTISRIDADGRITSAFRPEAGSVGVLALAFGESSLWVGSRDGALARLRPEATQASSVLRGLRDPAAIVVAYGSVWVAQSGSVDLLRVAPATNRVVARIPLGGIPTALAAADGSIWALTPLQNQVWRVSPGSNSVRAGLSVPADATALAAAGPAVWVSAGANGTLTRVDAAGSARLGHPIAGLASDGSDLVATTNA